MKKIILLILASAFCVALFAQEKKFSFNPWKGANGWQASAGYLNHFEADVSYIMTNRPKIIVESDYGVFAGFESISAGINYANIRGQSFIGPKAYFQLTAAVLTAQVGFDYLTNFSGQHQFRFAPKAGISLFGFVSVLYGYNFGLSGNIEGKGLTNTGMLHLQVQMPRSF